MLTRTEKEEEEEDDDEKVFHAFPGEGLVEVWLGRHCCQAPKSVPCA